MSSVTAIVVAFDSAHALPECLGALTADGVPAIVVDNASTDDSAAIAERHGARVVRNARNEGYGRANNAGARAADSEFILVVNPDVVADRGAAAALLDAARRYPDAGFFAPKIVEPSGRVFFQPRSLLASYLTNPTGKLVLPGVQFAVGESADLFCERTPRHTGERDDVSISISLTGAIGISQRGSAYVVDPGEAYVDLGDVPASARNLYGTVRRDISLIVPRRILRDSGVDAGELLSQPIAKTNPALQLIVSYAQGLRALGDYPSAALAATISSHLRDLAILAIGATGDAAQAARPGLRAARLAALKSDIARNVSPFSLSLEDIARKHGISPSYVRKLFAMEGTSFSIFVLQTRLDRAHHMLASPLYAAMTISGIAYECGFADLSYFNRAFRRRFDCTPGDTRSAALVH